MKKREDIDIKELFEKSLKTKNIDGLIKLESIKNNMKEDEICCMLLNYCNNIKDKKVYKTFNKQLFSSNGTLKEIYNNKKIFYLFLKHRSIVGILKEIKKKTNSKKAIAEYYSMATDLEKRSFLYALYMSQDIRLMTTFKIVDFKLNYYEFLEMVVGKEIIDENLNIRKVDIIDLFVDLNFSYKDFKENFKSLKAQTKNEILLFLINEGITNINEDFKDKKEEVDDILKNYSDYELSRKETKDLILYMVEKKLPLNEKIFEKLVNKEKKNNLTEQEKRIKDGNNERRRN